MFDRVFNTPVLLISRTVQIGSIIFFVCFLTCFKKVKYALKLLIKYFRTKFRSK